MNHTDFLHTHTHKLEITFKQQTKSKITATSTDQRVSRLRENPSQAANFINLLKLAPVPKLKGKHWKNISSKQAQQRTLPLICISVKLPRRP